MNRHAEVGLVETRLDLHNKSSVTAGRNQTHQGICPVTGVVSDLVCLDENPQPRRVTERLKNVSQELGLSISSFPGGARITLYIVLKCSLEVNV